MYCHLLSKVDLLAINLLLANSRPGGRPHLTRIVDTRPWRRQDVSLLSLLHPIRLSTVSSVRHPMLPGFHHGYIFYFSPKIDFWIDSLKLFLMNRQFCIIHTDYDESSSQWVCLPMSIFRFQMYLYLWLKSPLYLPPTPRSLEAHCWHCLLSSLSSLSPPEPAEPGTRYKYLATLTVTPSHQPTSSPQPLKEDSVKSVQWLLLIMVRPSDILRTVRQQVM